MKLFPLIVLSTILLSCSLSQKIYGQVHLTLTIDTFCINDTNSRLKGTFGLYEMVPNRPYSSELIDTLVRSLNYTVLQELDLIESRYKFIFTPLDSSQKPSVHYFHSYPGMPAIHLTCFFFNQSYPSFLSQMDAVDTLTFYASYFGNTHEEMLIPASQVSIIKKQSAYYMAYNKCDYYQHEPNLAAPRIGTPLVLLTKKEIESIRQFEMEICTSAVKDNLLEYPNAFNRIYLGGQQILFYSKSSISESLNQLINAD